MIERLLKKIKWNSGRRQTGYKTLKLVESKKFMFDSYLLYYPKGSAISSHIDQVDMGKHYRLSITLKNAKNGGTFILAGKPVFKFWRIVCFNPDRQFHSVSTIKEGYRLILSIGWVRKNKRHG